MRSDTVRKGTVGTTPFPVQCPWNDKRRNGQTTGRNRKLLQRDRTGTYEP